MLTVCYTTAQVNFTHSLGNVLEKRNPLPETHSRGLSGRTMEFHMKPTAAHSIW